MGRGRVVCALQPAAKGRNRSSSFVIDCSKPVDNVIMDNVSLEKFLQGRVKVGGKHGVLGDSIAISLDKTKMAVTSGNPFSKREAATIEKQTHHPKMGKLV